MHPAFEAPRLTAASGDRPGADSDLIIVPVAQDQTSGAVARLDSAVGGELSSALARGEFEARAYQTLTARLTDSSWRAPRMAFIGTGPRASVSAEVFRRIAAMATGLARQMRCARVVFVDAEPGSVTDGPRVELLAEGIAFANFDNGMHKTRDERRFFVSDATVLTAAASAGAAVASGATLGESINGARALVNEPGNNLTPTMLADRAAAFGAVTGVSTDILDEGRIRELQMGLLLGVARGSAEPPRVLVLKYDPPGAPRGATLGLVGKGITFDTGGLSLKPADGMERMKDDMAGGASVVAAIRSIALLQLPIPVVAVVPATENMPGGRAIKPGDILRGASGLTVEVNNTDAEGRLILGDGLWYARQLGATHLVDVATLTGAVVVALGKITTGLYGTPQPFVQGVLDAAGRAGEKVWQMPLFDEYKESLKSEIADMLNSPGRPAGSVTAAMFLKEFAGAGPWAHLDIAGTAWAEDGKPWQPKGATGAIIKTLVEVARGGLS